MLVVGLDGGDPALVERWIDELPNLGRIAREGSFGVLHSTMPPMTCPAWLCFMTGKAPQTLGVYDWDQLSYSNEYGLSSLASPAGSSLWDILSMHGKQVGVLNVPLTYPAHAVNGFMVSGFPSGATKGNYAYPSGVAEELDSVANGYVIEPDAINPDYMAGGWRQFVAAHSQTLEKHARAAEYLMTHWTWDLFVTVFVATDRISHYLWHFMDAAHPRDKPPGISLNPVKETYRRVDTIIGRLVALAGEDAHVIIMSDHGFGPHYGDFLINQWLLEEGFLKLQHPTLRLRLPDVNKVLDSNHLLARVAKRVLSRSGLAAYATRLLSRNDPIMVPGTGFDAARRLIETVDWQATRAIGLPNGRIYLNAEDPSASAYDGLRGNLTRALRGVKNPHSGDAALTAVLTREEVYGNVHANRPSDLIAVLDNHRYNTSMATGAGNLWRIPGRFTGDHRPEGLLMASGPSIRRNATVGANIVDLAPTILHFLEQPVPEDMDGRVLTEIFAPESEPARRAVVIAGSSLASATRQRIRQLRDRGRLP